MQRLLRTHWQALCLMIMLAVVLTAVQGCAALGVPTADTVNKKAAEGYITITAAANTVVTLRTAGKMSEADRDKTVGTLQAAKTGLDALVKSAPVDPAASDAKLREILLIINGITAALAAQQAGGK